MLRVQMFGTIINYIQIINRNLARRINRHRRRWPKISTIGALTSAIGKIHTDASPLCRCFLFDLLLFFIIYIFKRKNSIILTFNVLVC